MKFGGTSIKDASMIQKVVDLIINRRKKDTVIVVASALKGSTDTLLESASIAAQGKKTKKFFKNIYAQHFHAWQQLTKQDIFPISLENTFNELQELLHGIELIKECTARTKDLIVSFGERLSCQLITEYLNLKKSNQHKNNKKQEPISSIAVYVDSRNHIITDDTHGDARVNFTLTNKNIKQLIRKMSGTLIVTGFIGSTKEGITTTLGRNGSDYTASVIAAAIQAQQIEIWTDVDGVLSADPRIVKDAYVIQDLSYAEAMELSFYGAKVVHPLAIVPAVKKNIPILIKNTFNTKTKGTKIQSNLSKKHISSITGLASITRSGLLTVEGAGLSGNFYFLPRIFNVFAEYHVQPLMIAQASSEHSICFVFKEKDIHHIKEKLSFEFKIEIANGRIQKIYDFRDISIVSIIGSNMRGSIGLAGKVFAALGKSNINIIAIAQGSNEMNISIVVTRQEEQRVLEILHTEFF